ncbi:MAG: carbamoyltransferase [Fibrobacteres bacterium]|nr:carbamoyltransferase [Fibrobacterota bacterium]
MASSPFILGLSCFYHDSAAALLKDGAIVAAAQEERFTRKRHDDAFPERAVAYCLREAGISIADVGLVAFYDKPFLKFFDRIVDTWLAVAPKGLPSFRSALPAWAGGKLWMRNALKKHLGYQGRILFPMHHESHAASAFLPSPFEEAAVVTLDGVGEWQTTTIAHGKGNDFEILSEIRFPHSLGLLYSAFTYYAGFKVNSGEYKLMGLAPYGDPKYVKTILDNLIDLREDGSFRLNMGYFGYLGGLAMTNARFHRLFGGPPRKPESPLTQREMDLARSVQEVIELAVMRICRQAAGLTGSRNLCLAGGVALNCVANGKLLRSGRFDRIWIQPAAGDAGGALGAALLAHHRFRGNARAPDPQDSMRGALLGPAYEDHAIEALLRERGAPYRRFAGEDLYDTAAEALSQGEVIGWFQGRMEFGPRALGARSILADARRPEMQREINLRIKFREGFRPFAPAVLRERAEEWFGLQTDSPYMLFTAPVREDKRGAPVPADVHGFDMLKSVRGAIPAVTHVDGSARVQTVDAERNPSFHRLLRAFERKTGCPVLVNTSFNVRGEPIVCTPYDAYLCFMRTGLDLLVMGNFVVRKSEQPRLPEAEAMAARPESD